MLCLFFNQTRRPSGHAKRLCTKAKARGFAVTSSTTDEQAKHEAEHEETKSAVAETADRAADTIAAGLSKLHPRVTKLMQSGYMESVQHLHDRLMQDTWHAEGHSRALRRGVAEFEVINVEKQLHVDYTTLSKLYEDPNMLDVVKDETARMLARATILKTVDDRYQQALSSAEDRALELTEKVTTGPTGLLELVTNVISTIPGVSFLFKR